MGYVFLALIMLGATTLAMIGQGETVDKTPLGPLAWIVGAALTLSVPLYLVEAIGSPEGKWHHIKVVRWIAGFISYMRGMSLKGRILQLVGLWVVLFILAAFASRGGFWAWVGLLANTLVMTYTVVAVALLISDLFLWMGLGSIIRMIIGERSAVQGRQERGVTDASADSLASKLDKEAD